jgi:DNA polymerase-3 subunit delta'
MSDYVQNICDSFRSNSKAMSWLIVGGAGMGKMDLVRSIAQNLLGTQGMTSGFKVLECGLTEEVKKKIQKEILEGRSVENPSDEDRKSEITVEDVRQTLGFLSLKTSLPCKILVVSLAENMNVNAQNAFLKTLEEPFEKTLIFLLTENPARLLPTILSRCQKIYLNPMTVNELVDKIKQNHPDQENVQWIAEMSDGMPGIAEKIINHNGIQLYERLKMFFVAQNQLNVSQLFPFAKEVAKDSAQWTLAIHFIQRFLNEQAILNPLQYGEKYANLYDWMLSLIRKTDSLYLDKAQVLTDIILKISENLQ